MPHASGIMVQFSGQEMNSRAKGRTRIVSGQTSVAATSISMRGEKPSAAVERDIRFLDPDWTFDASGQGRCGSIVQVLRPRIRLRPFEFYRVNGSLLRKSSYEGGQFRLYSNREMGFSFRIRFWCALVSPLLTDFA